MEWQDPLNRGCDVCKLLRLGPLGYLISLACMQLDMPCFAPVYVPVWSSTVFQAWQVRPSAKPTRAVDDRSGKASKSCDKGMPAGPRSGRPSWRPCTLCDGDGSGRSAGSHRSGARGSRGRASAGPVKLPGSTFSFSFQFASDSIPAASGGCKQGHHVLCGSAGTL